MSKKRSAKQRKQTAGRPLYLADNNQLSATFMDPANYQHKSMMPNELIDRQTRPTLLRAAPTSANNMLTRGVVAIVCALALATNLWLVCASEASAASNQPAPISSLNSTSATTTTTKEANGAQLKEPLEQQATDIALSKGPLEAFEDLIAIGRVSLSPAPPLDLQDGASTGDWRFRRQNGRLVDRIAEPESEKQQGNANKLDYIVEFLRSNKLTRFCNLLTSSQAPLKSLVDQLNQMKQFTLFVPTNEALLLMPSTQLGLIQTDAEEAKQFLMAHVTGELVVPKLAPQVEKVAGSLAQLASKYSPTGAQNRWTSGRPLERIVQEQPTSGVGGEPEEERAILSLSNKPLRIITMPTLGTHSTLNSTKLELVVNGANVLSGHSHALQEPNNTQITYAIVHLIDRSLYPAPSHSLYEKIREQSPQFAKYLDQSQDQQLLSRLKLSQRAQLMTAFLPNDNSFRLLQTKVLDQLETNRTYLEHFLRSHFVDGLFFTAQLTGTAAQSVKPTSAFLAKPQVPRQLTSLSGAELEFEWKVLQSRQVIVVNSVPLLEHDQMALNGVVHSITRPIFERHLLDVACNCHSKLLASPTNSTSDHDLLLIKNFHDHERRRLALLNSNQLDPLQQPAVSWSRQPANSSWLRDNSLDAPHSTPEVLAPHPSGRQTSSELEREESQPVAQAESLVPQGQTHNKIVRAQRSENLIARNNRDFYRPSTAPVNVLLLSEIDQTSLTRQLDNSSTSLAGQGVILSGQQTDNWTNGQRRAPIVVAQQQAAPQEPLMTPSSFEVERYKIVLNATSRQKLREQQGLIMASSLNGVNGNGATNPRQQSTPNRFAYDQALSTQTSAMASEDRLNYVPVNNNLDVSRSLANETLNLGARLANQDQISSSSSTQRQQRLLLKFEAGDARDRPTLVNSNFSLGQDDSLQRLGSQQEPAGHKNQQQTFGKTVAPPMGATFSGCAFYDADCKRLMGRLVRLPPNPSKSTLNGTQHAGRFAQLGVTQASVAPAVRAQAPATTVPSIFDSTFGETTESPLVYAASAGNSARYSPSTAPLGQQQPHQQNKTNSSQFQELNRAPSRHFLATSFTNLSPINSVPARLSPLNQPLPPWSEEEHKQVRGQLVFSGVNQPQGAKQTWRGQEMVADIARIQMSPAKLPSGAATSGPDSSGQVLMVPVRMLQDSNILLPSSRIRGQAANQTGAVPPVYFAAQQQQQTMGPNRVLFSSNSQYFAPTVQPSYVSASQAPLLQQPLGRLTNFTALEMVSSSEAGQFFASSQEQANAVSKQPLARGQLKSPLVEHRLRTPAANFSALGQQQLDAQLRDSIKQARKLVRLQSSPLKQDEFELGLPGKADISVTSAKLNARPPANFSLATQASNQSPDVSQLASTTFARPLVDHSAPLLATDLLDGGVQSSADFFQNRTIAEIMEDSGLRIDGQQVTFSRLRECLEKADLFNLISQPGSALTIFMPTDAAFQRLVQQQAFMQHRTSRASTSMSARLTEPTRKYLIPLIAKMPNPRRPGDVESSNRLTDSSNPIDLSPAASSTALANRLTLDCSTQQARQLLLDHLSAQLVTPRQLQTDLVLSSLSGKRLLLSSVPSKKIVVVDGQPVIAATRAKNGMVYVVNKFLNISQQMPNVIDLLDSQPNLKTFHSYLTFASLSDRLKRETGPLTILAPTNEAFDQLSSAARQLINSDPSAMMDILRGHIIEGAQFGKLISMRNRLKTMNSDHFIDAKVIKPNIYQLDDQMTSMKLVGTAGNGVVNAIDRLIVPSWLRVATGTSRKSPINTIGSPESTLTARTPNPALDNVARLETNRQPATSSLNLPLLGNQPVRFEQPDARLAPPNSFSLAGSTTRSSADLLRNNLPRDTFDVTSGFDSPSNSRPQTSSFNESPFSRVADNLTSSTGALPGGRLSLGTHRETLDEILKPAANVSSITMTKNMQLIEKLADLMRAKKFLKYLLRSHLSSTLKPDMNYVILVPTDQAMERLPKQIIDMLEREPERLSDLVNFHVLDTTFEYINTIPDGQTLNTLNEKDILFNWHRNNTILTASGAVVLGGIQEENIALLIVDRVLYPTPGDLLSIVAKSPILSNFTKLIRNAGLESQLSLTGPFTLFAPSDFAFNQLDRRDFEFLQRDRETARRFLFRHLSQPAVFTSSIALSNATNSAPAPPKNRPQTSSSTPLMTISNSLGEELTLRQRNDYFSVNDVNFSYADVAATNGVMHVIDGML